MARDSDDDEDGDMKKSPAAAAKSKDEIEQAVKRTFDAVASEPLPDRLVDLLNTLKNGGNV